MEEKLLDNLDANPTEFADLALLTLIALRPFLTAVVTEVAILAPLLGKPAETLMVVKSMTNKTAILLPTFA